MLAEDGFEHHAGSALPALADLRLVLESVPIERAGARLHGVHGLREVLNGGGSIGAVASHHLGAAARPVRALLFDKSGENNWALGWHQDRTIAIAERCEVEGFGPLTVKAGMIHIEPPPTLQAAMITLRIHLDDVPLDNAPLLAAAGSHRLGRVPQADIAGVVRSSRIAHCAASAGDIWAYSTPIVHASELAARPGRRRVLQVDYAAQELPGGLRWLGI